LKKFIIYSYVILFLWSCQSRAKPTNNDNAKAVIQTPTISKEEEKKYHDLADAYLNSTLLRGKFNGSILIAKNGVPVYEKYVGFRDLRTKDTLTADTPLQIASTSKTLTAAAVLQLVQQGKLNLDTPVYRIFEGFPYTGVTVKMLLNHRSGLPNYLYYMEDGGWDRKKLATNTDVLNTLINWKPTQAYNPGRNFNYCNTNYVLLALIIEKFSGMPYKDYMQKNIFEPLGMTNTFVQTVNDSARVAPSFDGYGSLWQLDFSDGPYGDKNIYSTPRDLLKWDQSLYGESIISKQLLDSAFTPYSNEKPGVYNYGFGFRLLMIPNGKKVIYHHGRWHGFNSAFARLTDEKITIIILTNKFNRSIYMAARKMYNIFGNYDGSSEEAEE
jgi:CubicO group peptidase (beta-lactamase class C family)